MKNKILFFSANAQIKEDSLRIEKAFPDYVEGWAEGNLVRFVNGVSPELK